MSTTVTDTTACVYREIQYGLSRPPAAVGKRLRSEQELADLMNVGRWHVRESITQLVRQGILVRRRGSGTYMRKMPTILSPEHESPVDSRIEPHLLFAGQVSANDKPVLQPTSHQKQLQLSLWTDWNVNMHATLQTLLGSIVQRVQETGHRLSLHSLVEREGVPVSPDVLAGRLAENHYDGYLVLNRWSKQFADAMSGLHGAVLSFYHSTQVLGDPALITFDTEEATQRAISLLAEQGHERIGVLGFEDPSEPHGFKEGNYDAFMSRLGLKYHAVEFASKSPGAIWDGTRRMFSRPDRPQAVYVANDHALATVLDALRAGGVEPGHDVALITLSNRRGLSLPHGYEWSRMEFDTERLGIAVVDELLRLIQSPGAQPMAQTFHATWRPGKTHLCSSRDEVAHRPAFAAARNAPRKPEEGGHAQ